MPRILDIAKLLDEPTAANAVPVELIPAVLCRLAALQGMLTARLLKNDRGGDPGSTIEDRLLDVADVAERLGTSRDWLYRHANRLPFTVRVGRQLRFSARGVENYIQRRQGR